MINEFDCKLCKQHFKVNGFYEMTDVQKDHIISQHPEEWRKLVELQFEIGLEIKNIKKRLEQYEIFGEQDTLNRYVIN